MRPAYHIKNSPHTGSSNGILLALVFMIILVIGGAVYGIVQMQRGLDEMYRPFAAW